MIKLGKRRRIKVFQEKNSKKDEKKVKNDLENACFFLSDAL